VFPFVPLIDEMFDITRTNVKLKLAHAFCHKPFAAGSRNRVSENFARLDDKIILTMLVQRCDFEIDSDKKQKPAIQINHTPTSY
jgi:cytochrome P450